MTLAIGLISGGLDSMLAAELLLRQGIKVQGIFINTGFCMTEHRRKLLNDNQPKETVTHEATEVANTLRFPLETINIADKYWDIVLNPKYGYGKNVNPCIDCRIEMLRVAKKVMEERGADFVFTGEVLGQRPMTQHRPTMQLTEKEAGLEGRLLRPMSAQLLPPIIAEEEGKIDRDQLLGVHGRSRKTQIQLAKDWDIEKYAQPAGGCCFLIDESYSRKLNDLFTYKGKGNFGREEVILLNTGRHIRLSPTTKLISSRDESEFNYFMRFASDKITFEALDYPGSIGVADGDFSEEDIETAARIIARYGKGRHTESVDIVMKKDGKVLRTISATPWPVGDPELQKLIIS
ncbi:MAG: hypothetical protein KAI81_08885, partial [Candidatus Marinimicrobia bacterium]|nr:hypothetical protein [Candidatus Neomarinimicrobiota bacterium]